MKLKPEPVPRPGMAGGPNENATAWGTSAANRTFNVSTMPLAHSSGSGRSSQFSRLMKMNPLLVVAELESML